MRAFFAIIINLSPFLLVFLFNVPAFATLEGKASLEGDVFAPHQTFSLRIELSWEGEEEQFEIRAHRLELPEGIEEKGVSASALGGADRTTVIYLVRLAGEKEGEYSIKHLEIDYREKGKEEVFTKRLPGVSFTVAKKPIFGTKNQWVFAGGGLVIFLGLFLGVYFWQARRRRKKSKGVPGPRTEQVREQLLNRLEECRKFKTTGDLDRFFHVAVILHKEIASFRGEGDEKNDPTEMETLAERVKYGGVKAGSEVVEKHFRELERRVKNF